MATKTTTAETRSRSRRARHARARLCAAAWAIPGAAHFWLGRRQKGVVFFWSCSPRCSSIGLALHGRIFPFELSEPLGRAGGGRRHRARRAVDRRAHARAPAPARSPRTTYEYGNTFLIVAGLLNSLVVLDAFDIAMGRK